MSGLAKIQSGLSDDINNPGIIVEDWNNISIRKRAISGACQRAVQSAREKWQRDAESQARELATNMLMDFVKDNGIELPPGVSALQIITGKGDSD